MCLIVFAWQAHAQFPLVVAANRDEWYARPAAQLEWWSEYAHVLAGRDLEAGGTWMGVTRDGRFAAITNFRDPSEKRTGTPSRGALVADFLAGSDTPKQYMERVAAKARDYNGFNLLTGDRDSLFYFGSREGVVRQLAGGVYGLSNALLDTPWPKVQHAKQDLAAALNNATISPQQLAVSALNLLGHRQTAADDQLPGTGVSVEWERALSARHIVTDEYGTRTSSVLLCDSAGMVSFTEVTHVPLLAAPRCEQSFMLEPSRR